MGGILGPGDKAKDQARALQLQQQKALAKAAEPKGADPKTVIDPVAEAARRARLAALNRKGRQASVLSQGSMVTPAYSNTVLGS